MEKTNPVLKENIVKLEKAARKNDAEVYRRAAEELKKSAKNKTEVNVSKIERTASEGETVLVPGKVLGSGRLDKEVEVAAFQFSQKAKKIISKSGEVTYLEDLVEENPEGEKIRIVK